MAKRKHPPGCPCAGCPHPALPCGCVPSFKLCLEAERLWDAVAQANKEATGRFWKLRAKGLQHPNDWQGWRRPPEQSGIAFGDYEMRLAEFETHLSAPPEVVVQRSLLN